MLFHCFVSVRLLINKVDLRCTIPNSVTSIGQAAFANCGLTSVTIPNSVTSIEKYAFYGCSNLTSVTIPESVTSIENNTFQGCSRLVSITIPYSVTSIGDNAFQDCRALTSINIPEGVTTIGERTFLYCTSLSSVSIGNSVTTIGGGAFEGCNSLTSITIGNGVTSIGEGAFHDCRSLNSVHITDLTAWCNISFSDYSCNPLSFAHHLYINGVEIRDLIIPNSATSINNYSFYSCYDFTSVTIPNSISSIGKSAFSGCKGMTNVTIGNNVTTIGDDAFNRCSSLSSITIPNSVTNIGALAFQYCSSLTSITIPNSVTTIGNGTFFNCSELVKVSIGSGIKNIGGSAFAYCPKIEDVYCYAVRYPTTGTDVFLGSYPDYITLHVPEKSVTQYKNVSPWNTFYDVVPLDNNGTDIPGAPKCAKPSITYRKGQLVMNCATEGVEFVTDISDTDIKQHHLSTITLSATYEIRVYATKSGYNNSEIATATLCWIEVEPQKVGFTDDDPTGAKQLESLPVLIQNEGSNLTISGAPGGTPISVFNLSGQKVGSATASGMTTTIGTSLQSGEAAVVKIGKKAVKVVVK